MSKPESASAVAQVFLEVLGRASASSFESHVRTIKPRSFVVAVEVAALIARLLLDRSLAPSLFGGAAIECSTADCARRARREA